ncbi:acyltransferase [Bosea thiooxidans]|uniref:Acyltransferase n=1 Tax=Bosea thiooxidans TaxID=53254 RepID=A0A0Q3KMF3_9HYPH|nr:acyltransferase [Bosea thiooxidans]KQK30843.1 acyltransferase [Bosea thiooxidans]SKB32383.1 Peptidoglycan/LPS O-acetylase OafA/YrhL, contains acyltransferase and SGNH-hydrolase domains [Bosea thiooxidans]
MIGRAPRVSEALANPHNNFGLLRLVMAVAVVISHAFSVTDGRIEQEPWFATTGFTLGEHAVNGFFAISGFLVTMSFLRRGWRDYVLARVLRIAPGLIAAVLVVALVLGGLMTSLDRSAYFSDPRLWRFITATLTTFKSAAALPGVFENNPLQFPMGTVWTLKYETLCYIGVLVAGVLGLLARPRLALAALVALALGVVMREELTPLGPKSTETALRLPLIFLAGGVIYLYRERVTLSLPLLALALLALVPLSFTPLYKAALYLVTSWGLLVLALAPALTRRSREPPADLSYGVYLYGWPAQQALHALFPSLGAVTLLWPSLAVTFIVAALSWFLVEKPALDLKRRLLQGSWPQRRIPRPGRS